MNYDDWNTERLAESFDPSSTDNAMQLANATLRLLIVCKRVIDNETAGLRIGRDCASELNMEMMIVARRLGLETS